MAGSRDVQGGLLTFLDHPVEVSVEEREAWGCSPVAEETGFHIVAAQWRAEQRVVEQVDLPD